MATKSQAHLKSKSGQFVTREISKGGRFTVSGAGVLQISAKEILKTPRAKKQLSFLKDIPITK